MLTAAGLFIASVIMGSVGISKLQAAKDKVRSTAKTLAPAAAMGRQLVGHMGSITSHGHVLVDGNDTNMPCDQYCNTSPTVIQYLGPRAAAAWGGARSDQALPQLGVSGGFCDCVQDPSTPWGSLVQ